MLLCPKCDTMLEVSSLAPGARFNCPFCEREMILPARRGRSQRAAAQLAPPSEGRPRPDRSSLELQVIDLPIEGREEPQERPDWIDWRTRRTKRRTAPPEPRS